MNYKTVAIACLAVHAAAPVNDKNPAAPKPVSEGEAACPPPMTKLSSTQKKDTSSITSGKYDPKCDQEEEIEGSVPNRSALDDGEVQEEPAVVNTENSTLKKEVQQQQGQQGQQ